MKKLKMSFSLIFVGLIILAGGLFANLKIKDNSINANENALHSFNLEQSATTAPPQSPTLSSSSIFTEYYGENGNNLISSLQITIPINVTEVTIMQNIMNNSFKQEKDEKGISIPTETELEQNFYFTRTATYIVTFKNTNGITVSEDYYFSPKINTSLLQKTTSNSAYSNITYDKNLNKYFILADGTSKLEQDIYFDKNLYTLYLSDNYSKSSPKKINDDDSNFKGDESSNTAIYNWEIPKNSYGKVTVLLDSKNGYSNNSIDIYVINVKYETYYFDYQTENVLDKSTYSYGVTTTTTNDEIESIDGSINENQYTNFVFNKGITFNVNISKEAVYAISSSAPLENNAISECFNFLEFSYSEEVRNSSNTAYLQTNTHLLNHKNETNLAKYDFSVVDNCTYTIKTSLRNSASGAQINNDVNKFKIITKIPITSTLSGNRYILALYLDGVTLNEKPESLNYFNVCNNGYITEDMTIYTTSTTTFIQSYDFSASNYIGNRFHYYIDYKQEFLSDVSGYSAIPVNLINSSEFSVVDYGYQRKVLIERYYETPDDIDFKNFYAFTFNLTYNNNIGQNHKYSNYFTIDGQPSETWYETFHKLYNTTTENPPIGSNIPEYDEFPTLPNEKAPVIKFSEDYNLTHCVPIYMQVTYNGKRYENFYTPKANDEILFSEFGNYHIEIYIFPSYDFCCNIISESNVDKNSCYMSFSFNIPGPSIEVIGTDVTGRSFSLSNYMYTQSAFDIKVELSAGQKLIVYRNSEQIAEQTASGTYHLGKEDAKPGAYRVVVVDANGKELRETTFTVADNYYQGFSINKKDEYEELLVSVWNNETSDFDFLPQQNYYHLLDEGLYQVKVTNGEKINFKIKNGTTTTPTTSSIHITNYIKFEIKKSFFSITFENAEAGQKITENVVVTGYDGIEIQLVEVFVDGKLIDTIDTNKEASITDAFSSMSYDQSGQYTIKLTDKYGNSAEFMIEKYYQPNAALIVLIAIVVIGLFILLWLIFRSRRGLKVK